LCKEANDSRSDVSFLKIEEFMGYLGDGISGNIEEGLCVTLMIGEATL